MNFVFITLFCDAPLNTFFGFQNPATPVMEGIIDLHNDIFFLLIIILITVTWLLFILIYVFGKRLNHYTRLKAKDAYAVPGYYLGKLYKILRALNTAKKFTHNTYLELIWTIIPSIVLIFIAIPSFILLYSIDETLAPRLTIKIIGHQWYWSYECNDLLKNNTMIKFNYDSYMVNEEDLKIGEFRLLEVDAPLYLPVRTHIRLLITSADVLHSWAVPSLGIKMDAVPGRLNQVMLYIKRTGTFYGQCSEICGINHGFMPIVVHAIPLESFFYFFTKTK